ncbi:hypothetical protein EJB05_28078, partial [Eragrostis curvula]
MWTGGSVIEQVLEYAKLPTGEQHDELISEHQALESGANTADVQLTARLPGALTVDAKSQKQGHTVETEPVAPGVALLHAREELDTEAKAQTCRTTADVVVPVSGGPVLGDGVVHGEVVGVGSVPVFPGNILALANDNKKAPAFGNNISLGVGIVPTHEQGKSLAQSAVLQEISTEEDMATPSIALGPLLERALTGLKESMNKNKGAVADDAKCDIPAHLRLGFSGPCSLSHLASLVGRRPTYKLRLSTIYHLRLTFLREASRRRQHSVDEDSFERAERVVAKKNLKIPKGTELENSILSFTNKQITDSIKNIGISLGKEDSTVQSSVSLIKKIENDRFKVPVPKTGEDSHLDVDDSDCDIDQITLGNLCGDLTEVVMDDNNESLFLTSVDWVSLIKDVWVEHTERSDEH